jgi:hypothetical protein
VDRASAIIAEQVADLIRDQAWSHFSLGLAEALKDESAALAELPGFRRESRRIPPRRRTRESPHLARAGAD